MLNAIIHFSIKNKLIVGLMVLGLIVAGILQLRKLPIDALPDITSNQVQVITISPALAAPEVERLVTFTVEQFCSNIPGITEMRSISRFGLSVVTIVFDDDTDIYWARQQVAERLTYIKDEIPAGAGIPSLAPLTTGLGEVYQYIVKPKPGYENKYSLADLRSIQDWIIRRQLMGTPGVADVSSFGGHLRQYEVAFQSDKLQSMGVTVNELFNALQKNNQNSGGAYIEKNNQVLFIRTEGLAKNLQEIENIVVKQSAMGTPVLVRDLAKVQLGKAIRYGALVDGSRGETAGAVVLMLKGANGLQVVEAVKKRMKEIEKTLPEGVVVETFYDRSKMVNRAIDTVKRNLAEGALIVVAVLVFFLGNLRAGLIVASVIPLAMLFAFCMMQWLGVGGNLMSLGALDFGLIVDGAVIIVEAVLFTLHHQKDKLEGKVVSREEMDKRVNGAASKMMNAAVFGQVIILIVYLPILALSGIEGKMFRPMAQTVSFALIGAFLLSLTYVPMMSALFLSRKISTKVDFSDRVMHFLESLYKPALELAFRFKRTVVALVLVFFALALFLLSGLGGEFIPELEEGDFAVDTRLLTGSSLQASIDASVKASAILEQQFPEVEKIVCRIGASEIPTDPMPLEMGDLIVLLKDKKTWTSAETFDELADKMSAALAQIPGMSAGFQFPVQMRFNELISGARQDVVCKIFGDDLDSLAHYASKIGNLASKVDGAVDMYVETVTGLPQIVVKYNHNAIAAYGLQIEDVNAVVQSAFAGSKAGLIYEGERRYDLVLRLDQPYRSQLEDVQNLKVNTVNGNAIPLSLLASVEIKEGPNQIQREDAKRRIITAFNVRGRDIETVVNELEKKISKEVKLPPGYYITYGGAFQNLNAAKSRLMIAVPASLMLIFLLLYFAFRSLPQASLVFSAIPLSAIGGVFALWIRDMPFSISAGVGFIALFGVAVLNGIVLISEFNRLKATTHLNIMDIIREGTITRFRPVLLTAAVASLGFLPMAISQTPGAEVQRPLASVVIGGLISATFLTLVVLPVLYYWLHRKTNSHSNHHKTVTTVVLLFVMISGLNAQTPLALNDALGLLQKSNPEWQLSTLEIAYQEKLKASAGVMPKTKFAAELGQTNSANFDTRLSVLQAFHPFGQKKAESSLYDAGIAVTRQQVLVRQSELRFLVRSIYVDYLWLEASIQHKHYLDSLYNRLVKLSNQRKVAGETSALEEAGFRQQQLLLQQEVLQEKQEQVRLQAQLQVLLQTDYLPVPAGQLKNAPQYPVLTDTSRLAEHPAMKLQQELLKQAQSETNLLKSVRKPELEVGYNNQSLIGYQTAQNGTEKYYDASNRFSTAQVGLSIPILGKASKAKVNAAMAREKVVEKSAEINRFRLQAQYQELWKARTNLQQQVANYEQEILPGADRIIQLARKQLLEGELNYVNWLVLAEPSTKMPLMYYQKLRELQLNDAQLAYYSEIN